MKKAFTLAEIMIVLIAIGILTAVLLPSARNIMPDEDVITFKKTHNTLLGAIKELTTSDKYFIPGDLTKKPDGSLPDCCYHAHAFADVVNGEVISCNSSRSPGNQCINNSTQTSNFKSSDSSCSEDYGIAREILKYSVGLTCLNIIELSNKVQVSYNPPATSSSCVDGNGFDASYGTMGFLINEEMSFDLHPDGAINAKDSTLFIQRCTGIKPEAPLKPFSYAIRADGKVIASDMVDEWLEKSIQKK